MAKNIYSKKDLNKFRKEIQEKINELSGSMDGIRDGLNNDSKGNARLSQEYVYSVHI